MPMTSPSAMAPAVARGVLAGLAGTAVMTAFQEVVEMPLTGRGESYAPAKFAQKILPINPTAANSGDASTILRISA